MNLEIIEIVTNKPDTTFALKGRLDTNSAPQLEAHTEELYDAGIKNITVNMAECDFVSSAGLRVIVAMQKHAAADQSTLVFTNIQDDVMEVFVMTGFDKILTITKDGGESVPTATPQTTPVVASPAPAAAPEAKPAEKDAFEDILDD